MRTGPAQEAGLASDDGPQIDHTIRSTKALPLEGPSVDLVARCFQDAMPAIAAHFQLPLTRDEGPEFLRYELGDFFKPHADAGKASTYSSESSRSRLVSAILFLNDRESEPETFHGGDLLFYGLRDEPQWQKLGLPFPVQCGRLLAFRSSLIHEVTPVLEGRRYTAVTWYA